MARLDKSWTVTEGGSALASELHRVLEVSHRQAKGIMDAGCVKVNGVEARSHGHRLEVGDTVAVLFDPETEYQPLPRPRKELKGAEFKMLWEDKHLVFVDKPAGLLTVPTETSSSDPCLAEALTEHYRQRGFKSFKLFIAHRLDRWTSGVLVFAKTPEALHGLKDIFEEHKLHRIYKAILVGELPENSGVLTDKLVERQRSLIMAVVDKKSKEPKGAKQAITHYRVLERLPGHTVVEIKLETGRRNQIRVQFAQRGFPLLGDQVYGKPSALIDRQALHAELLGFRHPVTDDAVSVSTPMPEDMQAAMDSLRNRQKVVRAVEGQKGEEGLWQPKVSKEKKMGRVLRARRFEIGGGERTERRPFQRPEGGERPARKPFNREGGEDRPRRPFNAEGGERPARKPFNREGGEDRPRRPFNAEGGERPARKPFNREGGEDRPRRPFNAEGGERPARKPFNREGGEDRPRRPFNAEGGERPARKPFNREGGEDRPRRPFNAEGGERPARKPFNREGGEDRPRRPFNAEGGERPARKPFNREGGEDRPRRPFNAEGGERPARKPFNREGGEDRPRRPFNAEGGERPARKPFNRGGGEDRPRRPFNAEGGERPARKPFNREGGEDRPRRPFNAAGGERPARKPFGDRPQGGSRPGGSRPTGGRPGFKRGPKKG